MKINSIGVKNFRLLKDSSLSLHEKTTLIVGRNNSGKTSLTELLRRLVEDKNVVFRLEDFSLASYIKFWEAFLLKHANAEDADIRVALPVIEIELKIAYESTSPNLGALGDFIIDLNSNCTTAIAKISYELGDGKIQDFFEGLSFDEAGSLNEQKKEFFKIIKERIPKLYHINLLAEDPNDPSNQKALEWSRLKALIRIGCINAQRGLDDETVKDNDVLGKILESLFTTASSDSATDEDKTVASTLKEAVKGVQVDIDREFNANLKQLVPVFTDFGYPGLKDPRLVTETTLDVQRLLTNHTKVRYAGADGTSLPESFNGLGIRNLIFILLKLLEFFKEYKASQSEPGIHLIFIEEPEAHLHPQMQEVFIRKIGEISDFFTSKFNNGIAWPVQFIVSTHSSHIANEASFDATRYFVALPEGNGEEIHFSTHIKDLSEGLGNKPEADKKFLHQYMTLTRCDLLFADKAILIEGTSERLLLPAMIRKIEQGLPPETQKLSSQYISIMEVGGAYAHIFYDLLDFLQLRTLIITDLDTVKAEDGKNKKCLVTEGEKTSNECIKNWFGNPDPLTIPNILSKTEEQKISGIRRIAYQIPKPDDTLCGRSFEEDFIFNNPTLFDLVTTSDGEREVDASEKAKEYKKIDFALRYALEQSEWTTPHYIKEGLLWLTDELVVPETPVAIPEEAIAPKKSKKKNAE